MVRTQPTRQTKGRNIFLIESYFVVVSPKNITLHFWLSKLPFKWFARLMNKIDFSTTRHVAACLKAGDQLFFLVIKNLEPQKFRLKHMSVFSLMALNLVQHLSLLSLCLQNAALTICMRFSRLPHQKKTEGMQKNHLGQGGQGQVEGELHIMSTAVFSGKIMKLIVSAVLASFAEGFSLRQLLGQYCSLRNALIMRIPATVYSFHFFAVCGSNQLRRFVVSSPAPNEIVDHRIVQCGDAGRQLTRSQWLGILTCAVQWVLCFHQFTFARKPQGWKIKIYGLFFCCINCLHN